ncbi:MAG TPA: flavin reductase family protein [Gemmatimonadaceae bacterium]|nr:flavin reductase family protein [Gemmatimonadaceae bacterium]
MTLDPDAFRAVLGRFASGVTILTTRDAAGRDHGMTVSAFCSVSLEPPLVLACVDHTADMHDLLMTLDDVGVSILASGQEALSRRFAELESDRFDGIGYTRGERGVVLFDEALAHLECRVRHRHAAGDHTVFVCEVERATVRQERPLLYYRGGYAQLER